MRVQSGIGICREDMDRAFRRVSLAHLTLFSFLLKVPDLQRPSMDTTCETDSWDHPTSFIKQTCAHAEFSNNCTPTV